jgi:hypothetical protein
MNKIIKKCRVCGNTHLIDVINLGDQALTGVFPKTKDEFVDVAPLELVRCSKDNENCCGLVQLKHSFEPTKMYGNNYGYRSGLNGSMVRHLNGKIKKIESIANIKDGDIVVDIGSNDSTLLQAYENKKIKRVGIDPTGVKFKDFYPDYVELIPSFFSKEAFQGKLGKEAKAKVVTSIAMFYDLEEPIKFMEDVKAILAEDGLWHFEQSYMPFMLKNVSYDTICHEHLEYYALQQIFWMTEKVGFEIVKVEFNDINGGSFAVTVKHKTTKSTTKKEVQEILDNEIKEGYFEEAPYKKFAEKTEAHREELLKLINSEISKGKKIYGYGASTKGNVILQYCNITEKEMPVIAEVNVEKFGRFTPGTLIPIDSEDKLNKERPDYYMVLPWHFRDNILEREKKYLENGGKFIFPLPKIDIVGKE